MAKSARASSVKKKNQKLKKNVFGPVETARNERQSAKLLELASQPKPPRPEMDVDGTLQLPKIRPQDLENHMTDTRILAEAKDTAGDSEAKGDKATAGASPSLSIPIPASLLLHTNEQNLPTPPATPPADASTTFPDIPNTSVAKRLAKEQLFYHLLGASSDVLGFDENGDLELSFAGPQRDVGS